MRTAKASILCASYLVFCVLGLRTRTPGSETSRCTLSILCELSELLDYVSNIQNAVNFFGSRTYQSSAKDQMTRYYFGHTCLYTRIKFCPRTFSISWSV